MREVAVDYVRAIVDSVGRLGELVDDVLQLTQADAGLIPVDRETVDLRQVLEGLAVDKETQAAVRGHEFVVDIDLAVGRVEGDAKRLREAVDHLLANAIRYTPPGGRVLLHGSGDGERALIVVSDNGPGIDGAARANALDRFSPIREGSAQGLGLPLARQIVEAHRGTLTLLSEPGEGTAVKIELPR